MHDQLSLEVSSFNQVEILISDSPVDAVLMKVMITVTNTVIKNPLIFHHIHERSVNCQRAMFDRTPMMIPVLIAAPLIDLVNIPIRNAARIGPYNKLPMAFINTIVVCRVDSPITVNKIAATTQKVPHKKVMNLDAHK